MTFALIAIFVVTYLLLVRPKPLSAGLEFGLSMRFARGISSRFDTYIHMPIPRAFAWKWFVAGYLKGLASGAVLGPVFTESRGH